MIVAPSIGASYEISPRLHLGFEAWMRGEYPNPAPAMRTFGLGPQTYAGPTVMASFGRVWWAFGAYARVSEMGHDLEPGEPYGRIWVRSMIGYDLSK